MEGGESGSFGVEVFGVEVRRNCEQIHLNERYYRDVLMTAIVLQLLLWKIIMAWIRWMMEDGYYYSLGSYGFP